MIYKFLLISDEVEDFVREISIDHEATFLELQNAILESVKYSADQITSFFVCDDDWEKETEVTLIDMETSSYENDSWVMADTKLYDLIEDEKQHLLFVFDALTERAFFMELHEIVTGQTLDAPICTRAEGEPPVQLQSFDDAAFDTTVPVTSEALFDDDFDMAGFSDEGLDDLEILDSLSDFDY